MKRTTEGNVLSFTWIIEVSSQVIFSTSATVHYELLVGRNEKSIELGFSGSAVQAAATPGHLQDHREGKRSKDGHSASQRKGVLSKAMSLVVEDTESLWNKPLLPEWDDEGKHRGKKREYPDHGRKDVRHSVSGGDGTLYNTNQVVKEPKERKPRKVHLVVLTHGLHSNLGADMLYLKESIDATAKQAREGARKRRSALKSRDSAHDIHNGGKSKQDDEAASKDGASTAPLSGGQNELEPGIDVDSEDEEEVIVRGFSGNAVRTEKGIQYLGKRLAKYVLSMTYPDQPFLPAKKSVKKKFSQVFTNDQPSGLEGAPTSHDLSSTHSAPRKPHHLAYQITSISFVAHSLGGLTQTYAVAYIHKHSPQFFHLIKPINFVTMASPFLGLSNENPIYVKFALDFGLVGRTGQDLGLTWRGSTMVRSGWGAMIGGIGSEAQRAHRQADPGAKPLLRILPTGPAHQVLRMFRNRTVYSNVVNDGIVPLRTSCLLFLDWGGLGRVKKARRENGLVGTMAGWGWAELTGANSSSHVRARRDYRSDSPVEESGEDERGRSPLGGKQAVVPQPAENATEDDAASSHQDPENHQFLAGHGFLGDEKEELDKVKVQSSAQATHPLGGFFDFLRPSLPKSHHDSPKQRKIYKRSQTTSSELGEGASQSSVSTDGRTSPDRPNVVRRESPAEDQENVFAPPKTTFFESARDILNPPLPSEDFIVNPASRPRTIFHDRVYHPEDIPPPPPQKRIGLRRSSSSDVPSGGSISGPTYGKEGSNKPDTSGMKVEEKIARAYHRDLSWRKVLVRLEPDAHNNIIVRRMFSNAYGWPVIKHLVETHFADTYAATTADELEPNEDRAKPMQEPVGEHGEELKTELEKPLLRTDSEQREAKDHVSDLQSITNSSISSTVGRPKIWREDSALWDDVFFEVTDDDDDIDSPIEARRQRSLSLPENSHTMDSSPHKSITHGAITGTLSSSPPKEEQGLSRKQNPTPSAAPTTLHGSTTSIGLGKAVEKQLETLGRATSQEATEDEKDRLGGVSADVARLSIGKGH